MHTTRSADTLRVMRFLPILLILLFPLTRCATAPEPKDEKPAPAAGDDGPSAEALRIRVDQNPLEIGSYAAYCKRLPFEIDRDINFIMEKVPAASQVGALNRLNAEVDAVERLAGDGRAYADKMCRQDNEEFKAAYEKMTGVLDLNNAVYEKIRTDIAKKILDAQKQGRQFTDKALRDYQTGNFEEAKDKVEQALALDDTDAKALSLKRNLDKFFTGEALINAHKIDQAITHFEGMLADEILPAQCKTVLEDLRTKKQAAEKVLAGADRLFGMKRLENARKQYIAAKTKNEEFSDVIDGRINAVGFAEQSWIKANASQWDESVALMGKVAEIMTGKPFAAKWIAEIKERAASAIARGMMGKAEEAKRNQLFGQAANLLMSARAQFPDKAAAKKETAKLTAELTKLLVKSAKVFSKADKGMAAWAAYGLCAELGDKNCTAERKKLDDRFKPALVQASQTGEDRWATRLTALSVLREAGYADNEAERLKLLDMADSAFSLSLPTQAVLTGDLKYAGLPGNAQLEKWFAAFIDGLDRAGFSGTGKGAAMVLQIQPAAKDSEPKIINRPVQAGTMPGSARPSAPGLMIVTGTNKGELFGNIWVPRPAAGDEAAWSDPVEVLTLFSHVSLLTHINNLFMLAP